MNRLRDEKGMTLMEVLTALTIGFVVLAAMFTMLESSVRMNTGVMSKTDAMQRGRLAMDVLTQELRSQVCLENLTSPAIEAASASDNSVTFFSDFSEADGAEPPTKRTLTFNPDTGDITTAIYKTNVLEPAPGDYPVNPSAINMRLENAAPQVRDDGTKIPFLQYFAYQDVGNPPRREASLPLVPGNDGLTAAEAARVARIDIAFVSRQTGAKDSTKGVNLSDQIMARHSDPNLSVPDPKCV